MDTTLVYVIVALIFAGVVVYAITRYGQTKSEVTTPLGSFKIEGSNPKDETARVVSPPTGGVRVKDADVGGDATLRDRTGKGADVERIKTHGDLDVTSENLQDPGPKA
jgi:hypothetical protein